MTDQDVMTSEAFSDGAVAEFFSKAAREWVVARVDHATDTLFVTNRAGHRQPFGLTAAIAQFSSKADNGAASLTDEALDALLHARTAQEYTVEQTGTMHRR